MRYQKPMRFLMLLVSVCAGEAVGAQQAVVLPLGDVVVAMEAAGTNIAGEVGAIARLVRLTTDHAKNLEQAKDAARQKLPANQQLRVRKAVIKHHEPTDSILASGDPELCGLMCSIVTQLQRPEVRQLRLACTLVSMPEAVAEQFGLLVGSALPASEVLAGEVQKAAVKAQGSLQNLPEALAVPLVPFRIERPVDGEQPGDAPDRKSLRLRGEAVYCADDQAIFAVQLAAELPKDPTVLPSKPLLACTMPLAAGAGVILRAPVRKDAPENEAVVAVWFRFVDVVQAEQPLPKLDPGK